MKSGVNTSTVIHTKRKRKNIKPIKCNCNDCVNKGRNRCHYNLEPINGKCSRYETNDYKPTEEEKKESILKQKLYRDKEKQGNIRGLETVTIEKADLSKWCKYK